MNVLSEWAYIGVFFLLAPLLPALPIAAAAVFNPKKPNAIKQATYECGVETVGNTWVQFKIQYYVEMVFLFPWALAYGQLDFFAFLAGLLFIFLLTDALIYAWRKNALEWV